MRQPLFRLLSSLLFAWALIASLILTACNTANPAGGADATPTAIPTPIVASKPTYTVQRGDVVSQMQFGSRIIPAVEEALFFRSDGRVRSVYVKSGDTVTAGQVLADLISLDELEKTKLQDELALRRAEINVEMARLRQSVSATRTPWYIEGYNEQMQMSAYEVELAQIALEEQKLRSSKVETTIQDSQIVSPIQGRVLSIRLKDGDPVQAYDTVAVVGDDTLLEAGARLVSTQMELLTEGMPCIVELVNRPGDQMTGTIRQMPYPYGTASEKTVTGGGTANLSTSDANTRIAIQLIADLQLKMSDMVNVTVILESKSGVLWLPPAAIRTFEGRNFVVVQTDTTPRRVDIKVGIRNEDQVEIVEGLEEGQIVIAP